MIREMVDGKKVVVTQEFLDWCSNQDWETRTDYGKDCLLLEYTLLKEGKVEKGYDIIHDFIYEDMRVDVKEVQKYFNVYGRKKIQWWNEGLDEGSLTHFLFVQSDRKSPLQVGDEVTYYYVGLWPTEDVLDALIPSFKVEDGFYIPTPILRS